MSRREVIRRIVQRDNQKQGLTEESALRDDAELHALACQCFGTWDTALQYAGISIQRLVYERKYGPEAVKRRLARMCREGHSLVAAHVRSRDPHLYRAALRQFATWEDALRAAGINPEHIRCYRPAQRPSKQQVLETLINRQQQGLSLRWSDICRENRAFAVVTKHMFGSWARALAAAGVSPERTPRSKHGPGKR